MTQAQKANEMQEVLRNLERGHTVISSTIDKVVNVLQRCITAVLVDTSEWRKIPYIFNAIVFTAIAWGMFSIRKDVRASSAMMQEIIDDQSKLDGLSLLHQQKLIYDNIAGIFDDMMSFLQVSMTLQHFMYTLQNKWTSANVTVIIFTVFVSVSSMWLGYQGCLTAAPDTTMLDIITMQPHVGYAMQDISDSMTHTFSSVIWNTIHIQTANLCAFVLGRAVQKGKQFMNRPPHEQEESTQAQALVDDVSRIHDESRDTFTTLMTEHALSLLKDVKMQTQNLSCWAQNKSYDLLDTACLKLEGVRTSKGQQKDELLRQAMELMFQADSIVNGELDDVPSMPALRKAVNHVWLGLKQCLLIVGNTHNFGLLIE